MKTQGEHSMSGLSPLASNIIQTRGPKGHISCTWIQCTTLLEEWPGQISLVFRSAQEQKFGRGHWVLASCQVSSNSIQPIKRNSRKCLSQSEVRVAILFFNRHIKKTNLERMLSSCFLSRFGWFHLADSEMSKMSWSIRGQGGHLVFLIGPTNTNLVEDV